MTRPSCPPSQARSRSTSRMIRRSADVVIEDSNGKKSVRPMPITGQSTTAEFTVARPYTFYCSLPGHEEAGMKGTLTVKIDEGVPSCPDVSAPPT